MCKCINVNVFKVSKVDNFTNIVVTGFSLTINCHQVSQGKRGCLSIDLKFAARLGGTNT